MDNLKGKTLGRYHLIEPLGEGGMAMVYKAYDANLERKVAIKVIRTDKGQEENFLRRFQREAKALAQLDHPYILKVLDYGEQDGIPYLVMPFIPGGTLKLRMGKALSAAEAARMLAPIARALDYAHQQGIIHRDVKPANILITQSGAPILSDFGIARILESQESTQLTATGIGIGTPDYMAPEQWLGTSDARTDIYALGVVFYEMITGRRPYTADTPAAVLLKHMQDPLPRPSDFIQGIPEAAEQIIYKSLAKEPAGRYANMGQMAAALERLAQEVPAGIAAEDETLLEPVARPAGTQPSPAAPARTAARSGTAPPTPGPVPAATPLPSQPISPEPNRLRVAGIAGGLVLLLIIVCLAVGALAVALNFNRIKLALSGGAPVTTQVAVQTTAPQQTTPQEIEPVSTLAAAEPTQTPPAGQEQVEPTPETEPTKAPLTKIEGLPEDVPLVPVNNGDLITTEQEQMSIFVYTTQWTFAETEQFFRDEMDRLGWKVESTTSIAGEDTIVLYYVKGERMVMINLVMAENDNGPLTTVQMMVQEPAP